jgi:hypothetical protein
MAEPNSATSSKGFAELILHQKTKKDSHLECVCKEPVGSLKEGISYAKDGGKTGAWRQEHVATNPTNDERQELVCAVPNCPAGRQGAAACRDR